jgi:hypothetical protein
MLILISRIFVSKGRRFVTQFQAWKSDAGEYYLKGGDEKLALWSALD